MPSGLSARTVYSGSGAPTSDAVPPDALYFNIDNGYLYQWDGSSWNLISSGGGGGSGDPEVFALAGSSSPGAAPAGGAGVAYNVAGSVWVYSGGAWVKILN